MKQKRLEEIDKELDKIIKEKELLEGKKRFLNRCIENLNEERKEILRK